MVGLCQRGCICTAHPGNNGQRSARAPGAHQYISRRRPTTRGNAYAGCQAAGAGCPPTGYDDDGTTDGRSGRDGRTSGRFTTSQFGQQRPVAATPAGHRKPGLAPQRGGLSHTAGRQRPRLGATSASASTGANTNANAGASTNATASGGRPSFDTCLYMPVVAEGPQSGSGVALVSSLITA
jgi:hypothetical protein